MTEKCEDCGQMLKEWRNFGIVGDYLYPINFPFGVRTGVIECGCTSPKPPTGTEGQDRKCYTDTQDRENYTTEE